MLLEKGVLIDGGEEGGGAVELSIFQLIYQMQRYVRVGGVDGRGAEMYCSAGVGDGNSCQ